MSRDQLQKSQPSQLQNQNESSQQEGQSFAPPAFQLKASTAASANTSKTTAQMADGERTGTITAQELNVRSGPSGSSTKVGTKKNGDKVTIFEEKNGWIRIGDGQWVSANYVKIASQANASAPQNDGGPNMDQLAQEVYEAMFGGYTGMGTDEEKVYQNLSKLNKDNALIGAFKDAYKAKFGRDVVGDIMSEFSDNWLDNELSKALGYLNISVPAPAPKPDNADGSDSTGNNSENGETQATETFDASTLKDKSAYAKSVAAADQLYGTKQNDLGLTRKKEAQKGEISWKSTSEFADEDAYYAAIDAKYAKRNEKEGTKITDDQKALLEIARKASRNESFFQQVIQSNENGKKAKIDYANAQLSNDAFTFSSVLKTRIERFHKFVVTLGMYSNIVEKPGSQSCLRDRPKAHLWATEHNLLYKSGYKDHYVTKLKAMNDDATFRNGDNVVDKDGNSWAKSSHFVDSAGKQVGSEGSGAMDKTKSFEKIKAYVDTKNYRSNKSSAAAEGYEAGDVKRWPTPDAVGVSNHIDGNAIDLSKGAFGSFMNDPIIDFIAWEFGVVRNTAREQWHFEATGMPKRKTEYEE